MIINFNEEMKAVKKFECLQSKLKIAKAKYRESTKCWVNSELNGKNELIKNKNFNYSLDCARDEGFSEAMLYKFSKINRFTPMPEIGVN